MHNLTFTFIYARQSAVQDHQLATGYGLYKHRQDELLQDLQKECLLTLQNPLFLYAFLPYALSLHPDPHQLYLLGWNYRMHYRCCYYWYWYCL